MKKNVTELCPQSKTNCWCKTDFSSQLTSMMHEYSTYNQGASMPELQVESFTSAVNYSSHSSFLSCFADKFQAYDMVGMGNITLSYRQVRAASPSS